MKKTIPTWAQFALGAVLMMFGGSVSRNAVADGQSAAYLVATGIGLAGLLLVLFALGTWVVKGIKRLLRRG